MPLKISFNLSISPPLKETFSFIAAFFSGINSLLFADLLLDPNSARAINTVNGNAIIPQRSAVEFSIFSPLK